MIGEQKFEIPRDPGDQKKLVAKLRKEMFDAAAKREFERAASIRDAVNKIEEELLKV